MTKCEEHQKDCIGLCLWCGKQICRLCVGKEEGRKLYCRECTQKLGNFERTKVPLDSIVPEEHIIRK